jgi:hypothetical protein
LARREIEILIEKLGFRSKLNLQQFFKRRIIMWRVHTSLLVILAVGVSSLFASQGQQSKPPVNCLKYSAVSSAKTLSRENKVPVSEKRNYIKQTSGGLMLLDSVVEVSSDITTNQIWTAGNTYHITANISVQALLVIEPGTTVMFSSGTSMYVNNGGTLISCGTPDNPIIYTSDSASPYYGDYYCAIYIGETASASTKITYNYIEYAEVGIWVMNNRLDSPIENNYLYSNSFGILEYGTGHTDIYNNLIYASYNYAIEVHMSSYDNLADSGSHILIQNNTCDYYQDVGILVLGVESPDQAGQVNLVNNIVSGAYQYGLVLANGYMYYTVNSTGYYNNAANTYDTYDQTNPVIETTMPYVNGTGTLPICYLSPNSSFVNASDEYIEQTRLISKTTDINGFPDSNKADLGFHYPNWHFSNAGSSTLTADFDNSYTVDFNDLSDFVDYWLYDYNDNYNCWWWDFDDSGNIDINDFAVIADYWLTSFDFVDFADFANYWRRNVDYKFQDRRFDLNSDGFVDFKDFAMFADQWRQTTDNPTLTISVTLSSDPNFVSGNLLVSINEPSDDLSYCLYLDGQRLGNFVGSDMEIPTYELRNGIHEIKVITATLNENVIAGSLVQIMVQNRLHCLTASEAYKFNESYGFAGFYEPDDSGTINLQIKNLDDNVIWSNSSPGDFYFVVPAGILDSPYNQLIIQETGGLRANGYLAASSWPAEWIADIVRGFNVTNDPNAVNAQSLLVGVKERWTSDRREVWKEYLTACKERNLGPTICLFYGQATRENIQMAFRRPSMKSILIITDGNRKVGVWNPIGRTFFEASDGFYFSYLGRNRIGQSYEPLPPQFEAGYSVEDSKIYFQSHNRLYVMIDACKNGTSVMPIEAYSFCGSNPPDNQYTEQEYERTADMAHAFSIYDDPIASRLYMSWRKEAFGSNPLLRYNNFLQRIWYQAAHYEKFGYAISDAATFESGNCIVLKNLSYVGNTDTTFGQ